MGGVTASFTYYNSGLVATNSGPAGTATYAYDAAGNRTSEVLVNGGETIKNKSATYDSQGRLVTWAEVGTAKSPAASTANAYDANGNVRRTQANYRVLDAAGTASPQVWSSDYWYRYDSMNRLVTDKGTLSGTAGASGTMIVRGYNNDNATQSGRDIFYDTAGQRLSVATTFYMPGEWVRVGDPNTLPSPDDEYVYSPGWWQEKRENYTYDGAGRLTEVRNAAGSQVQEDSGGGAPSGPIPAGPATGGGLRSTLGYDLLGRLTSQEDRGWAQGSVFTGIIFSRSIAYNAKGQVTSDDVMTVKARYGNNLYDTFRSVTTYGYGSGSSYALGSVVTQAATNTKMAYGSTSWSSQPGTLTTTAYTWYDGAVQDLVTHDYDTGSGSNPIYTTDLQLNAFGQLTGATVNDGIPKSVAYTLDEAGQIIRRDESRTSAPAQGAPHEVFYRFGGRQIGMTGNNGSGNTSYTQSVEERSAARPEPTAATAGLFRNGTSTGAGVYADFSLSYDPYNAEYQGSAGGSYTVRAGDTLASIAQTLWGDANLWYTLAAANGVSGNAGLIEGQVLVLPTGVTKSGHSASTFKPYDPTDALGDLSPTTPKPPKKPKCGMLGMIVVAAIAIGLSAWLGPQMIGAAQAMLGGVSTAAVAAGTATLSGAALVGGGIIGGAAAGALASAVSQGVGVAIGAQSGFSWKGVGLAAIGGGIGGGITGLGDAAKAALKAGQTLNGLGKAAVALNGNGIGMAITRGAGTNALTQGIGLAAGLQSKFDFAGVAAAGAISGIAQAVSNNLPNRAVYDNNGLLETPASTANTIVSSAAGAIAGAATRSAITGESFGDNLMRALPDVIANSLILAGRSVLAQNGGNDGRDIRVAYNDQSENGRVIQDYQTIVVTAQRQATSILALISGLMDALGSPNTLGMFATLSNLDRFAMKFTNPTPPPSNEMVTYRSGRHIPVKTAIVAARLGLKWLASPSGTHTTLGNDMILASGGDPMLGFASQAALRGYYPEAAKVLDTPRPVSKGEILGNLLAAVSIVAPLVSGLRAAGPVGSGSRVLAAESTVVAPLQGGVAHEAERLAQLGIPKNNTVWRPTQADFDSAAFKVIVGEPKFTKGGLPKGTIFDGAAGGNLEIKGGASMLDSSYQLRLQTYRSLKTNTPFTIETTRPINPAFQSWLDRWGVSVARPK